MIDIEIVRDNLNELAYGSVMNPLDVGFRHGPMTIKDYEDYVLRVRFLAKGALEFLDD